MIAWLRSLLQGTAHTLDIGGTLGPKREDLMTDEEAFAYDREMLTRDWEAILGPREEWRKPMDYSDKIKLLGVIADLEAMVKDDNLSSAEIAARDLLSMIAAARRKEKK